MDKNKVIESAAKLIAKGQFEKAVKEYQRILDADPDDVRVLQKLAELYQKMGRKEEAADCFEKVAKTYAAQGFYLKAVALYKQVLKVVERIEVNVKLAELYQQLGLVGDATKEWQNVAGFYEKKGDIKQSLDVLKKLVDLDGDNVAARIRLGEAYARQEQNAQAVQELRRAALYLRRNGRHDDYLRVAERISHLDPSDVQLARDLAEIYLGKGDSKRALSKLQICFKANPRDVGTLQLLARAFQELGQVSKTVSVLKELARVHVDQSQPDDARRAYRQALELTPEDSEARQALRALEPQAAIAPAPGEPRVPTPPSSRKSSSPGIPRVAGKSSPGVPRIAAPPPVVSSPPPPPSDLTPLPSNPLDDFAPRRPSIAPPSIEVPRVVAGEPAQAERAAPPGADAEQRTSRPGESTHPTPASLGKLLKETDVYLKYRLFEKAFEHVGKILALAPDNAEAHEKGRAVAQATGRTADAIASLVALIRIYGEAEPQKAAVAREDLRALDPDHKALRVVHERDEAVDEAELHELAEEASGEILAEVAGDDPESTPISRAHQEPKERDGTGPQESGAAAPHEDAFASDLAEADFYLQQGLADDARAILEGILLSEPDHLEAGRRLQQIDAEAARKGDSEDGRPEITLLDARPVSSNAQGDAMAAELAAELAADLGAFTPLARQPDVLDPFQVPASEVASAFRAKVQEVIRPDDAQTHYDLGIAYKEMGLTDEAIAEFELTVRHGTSVRAVDCYTMLGQCMLEKGEPEAAISHYQSALAERDCGPEARKALAFEIGAALEALGKPGEALEAFSAVSAQDPRFRDVAARVDRLSHEVTGNRKAAGRAAQPLVKKPAEVAQEHGDELEVEVSSDPVITSESEMAEGDRLEENGALPASAEAAPGDVGRRNRKIGFV